MAVRARITGMERLKPQAARASDRAGMALTTVLMDGAAAVAANARAHVLALRDAARPGPSELAESIRMEETDAGARVVAEAPHAPYVEFGTRHAAAQPFLAPAFEEERPGIIERAARALRDGGS